jgi:hypothetical protein
MFTGTVSYTIYARKLYLVHYVHRNCVLHSMCTETLSNTLSRFTATKCSEQTLDSSNPPYIVYVGKHYAVTQFNTATAYVVTTLSELLSDSWDLSKCQYQVLLPIKCENTKFVTHFWGIDLLNFESWIGL